MKHYERKKGEGEGAEFTKGTSRESTSSGDMRRGGKKERKRKETRKPTNEVLLHLIR